MLIMAYQYEAFHLISSTEFKHKRAIFCSVQITKPTNDHKWKGRQSLTKPMPNVSLTVSNASVEITQGFASSASISSSEIEMFYIATNSSSSSYLCLPKHCLADFPEWAPWRRESKLKAGKQIVNVARQAPPRIWISASRDVLSSPGLCNSTFSDDRKAHLLWCCKFASCTYKMYK